MQFFQDLPLDNTWSRLPESLWRPVQPQPFERPHLVIRSDDCLSLLGLDPRATPGEELTRVGSGNKITPAMRPLAQKYTGHQFGAYNPDLGDGRGILLGEVNGATGHWDLHLKGAARTPFARMGDGRAVLRSCIREFLASEHLHALGIPTTRALCVVGSDEPVQREQLETGAMLLRVARTHARFGHFEYLFHTQQHDLLREFTDYVIDLHFPELAAEEDRLARFFNEVVRRTAVMIARWQAFGFSHGVMNTDNMSIIGDTFDYGPYGFMDDFDPGYICNHTDWAGRYAFNKQPQIGLWNLNCLAMSLSPLLAREQLIEGLQGYQGIFNDEFLRLMRDKLGLREERDGDEDLLNDLLLIMARNGADYTRTFRGLCRFDPERLQTPARDEVADLDAFDRWSHRYAQRLRDEQSDAGKREEAMTAANPKYILRNYLAQNAIEAAQRGDYSEVRRLAEVLSRPFEEQPEHEDYAKLPPDWGRRMVLSCSS